MDQALSDVLARVANHLSCLLQSGWSPPFDWEDPVQWRPREKNTVADYLANYTMDVESAWSRTFDWPFPNYQLDECCLVLHFDGGTRRHRCSGAAWVADVGAFAEGQWTSKHLAMGGTYYDAPISSFTAETLALAEGSLFLQNVVSDYISKPLGKRRRTK